MKNGLRSPSLIPLFWALVTSMVVAAGCLQGAPQDEINEQDGSLRGVLAIYMSDDPDGQSDTRYALRVPSGIEHALVFDHDVSDLIPGVELKVWGPLGPQGVRVSSFRIVSPPIEERTSALIAGTARTDRAFAFVLVDMGGGINVTADAVMGRMVNDANSIRNYYLYDSYGLQNIRAQVFGPLTAPPIAAGCPTNATGSLASSLRGMIPGTFQHYLWYFGSRQTVCSWAGLASVGTAATPSRDTWYNASTSCVVLVQEPGHNFGMQHSSSIRCPGAPLADDTMTCTASEYGDVFDPMGGGCRHMNAWQKAYQGWFGGCNGVNITATGTFTLLPFEMRCNGAQFLQIPAPKTRMVMRMGGGGMASVETLTTYFVELRTPLDFETTLGGGGANAITTPRVLLHIANDIRASNQRAIHPYIIDMTPNTTTFTDAALAVGQTFTDPAGGLTITATAVSATRATIDVTVAGGTGAPTCLDDSAFAAPGPGPEVCVANTATPVGADPLPGSGGAPGTGGAGGRAGTGGTAGRAGTGGIAAAGGMRGTGGTGGSGIRGTGGVIAAGSGGAGAGGTITVGAGGAPGNNAGAPGIHPDVSAGCGCAVEAQSGQSGTGGAGAMIGVALMLLGPLRRRRRRS
jgi:MYXO-CTERM domain-containing protein